jgi:hypothetical protein
LTGHGWTCRPYPKNEIGFHFCKRQTGKSRRKFKNPSGFKKLTGFILLFPWRWLNYPLTFCALINFLHLWINIIGAWIVEHWSDTSRLQKATPRENGSAAADITEHPADPSQQSGSMPIHPVESVGDEPDAVGVSSLPPRHTPLQAFPKEFNKSYLEALDRRYAAILLLLLVLEPLLVWYVMRTYPVGMTEHAIAKLQSKYADIFLSDFKVEPEPDKEIVYNELLLRATEAIPQIVGEATGSNPVGSLPWPRGSNLSPEARALPGEYREALRKIGASDRQRGMERWPSMLSESACLA